MDSRKYAVTIAALALSTLAGVERASAQDTTRRNLSGFDSIVVHGGVDVTIRQGDEFLVEIESSGDDAAGITTEVDGNVLEISRARSGFRLFDWTGGPSVNVTLPRLVALTASGGSDVDAEGTITGEALTVESSGGADLELAVDVDALEVTANGGADVSLTGTARSARVRVNGGSDLSAFGLEVGAADLESNGGSDITITVLDSLVARAAGGSDILYAGDPETVDVDASRGAGIGHR